MLRKTENFVIPPRTPDERPLCKNPVIPDFADPSVSYDPETGYYYACRSRFHPHGVNVCRGRTLSALFDEHGAFDQGGAHVSQMLAAQAVRPADQRIRCVGCIQIRFY